MDILLIIIIYLIAIIMGLTDYFGHRISGLASQYRDDILSFSSGLLISLLFLILVPDLISLNFSSILFLFMLIGFILMHMTEKYIYRHVDNKQKVLEELKVLHIAGFGFDNFMVGFIIATVIIIDPLVIIELSAPLFLQMLTSSISLDSIDTRLNDRISKTILSLLPIIGASVGLILELEQIYTNYVLAFALGVLFYMIIRDVIPQGKRGNPSFFLVGSLITIILWAIRFLI
ncbi:MAG: ZIP Zinc transporter [Promethearchaeota archaeon]|nr:MAG: ZIP Zinc transporter [Candidatus Lokiarchaeota archaeon]